MSNPGHTLRALRIDEKRWAGTPPTLDDIAKQLVDRGHSVDKSQLSRWERGVRPRIPSDVLIDWLDVLQANPGERAACVTAIEEAA